MLFVFVLFFVVSTSCDLGPTCEVHVIVSLSWLCLARSFRLCVVVAPCRVPVGFDIRLVSLSLSLPFFCPHLVRSLIFVLYVVCVIYLLPYVCLYPCLSFFFVLYVVCVLFLLLYVCLVCCVSYIFGLAVVCIMYLCLAYCMCQINLSRHCLSLSCVCIAFVLR